jgi:hypothetical protein
LYRKKLTKQIKQIKQQHQQKPNNPGGKGQLKSYHACICCADENLDLANTIINKYKKEQDADLFLPQEALLSGRYEFEKTY